MTSVRVLWGGAWVANSLAVADRNSVKAAWSGSECVGLLFLLQQYSPLLAAFTTQGQSELTLLLKIQEYCYDNIHFMKAFQKIVVLFYKGNLLWGCSSGVLWRLWGVGFFLRCWPVSVEYFSPAKTFREYQGYCIAFHELKNFLPSVGKDGAVKCQDGRGCPWHMGKCSSIQACCLSTWF